MPVIKEAKMEDSEVLAAAKKLAKNGKNAKTKEFGQGLVDFYDKNGGFTPAQVSGLQNIMKNAGFQLSKSEGVADFIGAASKAKVAGKKEFEFEGEKYPVKISDKVAKKVSKSMGESVDLEEAASRYKKTFIAHAEEIAKNVKKEYPNANETQLLNTVRMIMSKMSLEDDNPNFKNFKKYMPKNFDKKLYDNGDGNTYDSEWMSQTDAKQNTIFKAGVKSALKESVDLEEATDESIKSKILKHLIKRGVKKDEAEKMIEAEYEGSKYLKQPSKMADYIHSVAEQLKEVSHPDLVLNPKEYVYTSDPINKKMGVVLKRSGAKPFEAVIVNDKNEIQKEVGEFANIDSAIKMLKRKKLYENVHDYDTGQERLEPRADGEYNFQQMHTLRVFDPYTGKYDDELEDEEDYIEEKAVSQQQQKLMGLAYAYKKGDVPESEVSDEVKKIADQMSMKESSRRPRRHRVDT